MLPWPSRASEDPAEDQLSQDRIAQLQTAYPAAAMDMQLLSRMVVEDDATNTVILGPGANFGEAA